MNTLPPRVRPRRRVKYIDHAIQRGLLFALVLMEVALVAVSTWLMDLRLHQLLEESLYRSHFAGVPLGFASLLKEGGLMMGAFVLVNLIALIAADAVWASYVNGVLSGLRARLRRVAQLDFTPQAPGSIEHPVLTLSERWSEAERRRLAQVRALIDKLTVQAQTPDPAALRSLVEELRSVLPAQDMATAAAPAPLPFKGGDGMGMGSSSDDQNPSPPRPAHGPSTPSARA
jgi:hypothetical protein